MNTANACFDSVGSTQRRYLLATNRKSREATATYPNKVVPAIWSGHQSRPTHADGFLSCNLWRQIAVAEVDIRLSPAGKHHHVCSGARPASHGLAVLRLHAGFSIGSREPTVWDRIPVIAQKLGPRYVGDRRVRELCLKTIQYGNAVRRGSGVVAEQHPGFVGERTDNSNPLDPRFERKSAVVLQQDHGLVRKLARQRAMFGAIKFFLVDLCVGHHIRRIEHAKLHSCSEQADHRSVQRAFWQVSLLHRVDIGLVDRVAKPRSEGDALVIHASDHRNGRALCLSWAAAMIGSNVSNCIAVRNHIALEAPLAAQLVLQQVLVRACWLTVDRVVSTHN